MVAEWVDDTAYAPAVVVFHVPDDGCPCVDGALECCVGVLSGEDHADGAPTERLGAEVFVGGGLVGDPECCSVDGKLGDDRAVGSVEAEDFGSSEGGFVEVDCFGCVPDGKHGGDGGGYHGSSFRAGFDIFSALPVDEFLDQISHDDSTVAVQMHAVAVKVPAIHLSDLVGALVLGQDAEGITIERKEAEVCESAAGRCLDLREKCLVDGYVGGVLCACDLANDGRALLDAMVELVLEWIFGGRILSNGAQ